MNRLLVFAAAVLATAPLSPAVAQTVETSAAANQFRATESVNNWAGFDRRHMSVGSYLDITRANYLETQNPRRIRRAEAAAALVNAGDCRGARAVAARDNDLRLLARLDDVCGRGAATAQD